ncbi:hypothetical protein MBLNU13_g06780t1 [Cladosporium sp. NU13]
MQSLSGIDELMAGKRQRANGGRGPSAMNQRTYDHITTSDNARAQFGDQYNQTFTGPVHQIIDSTLPSTSSTPQPERTVSDALAFDGMDARRTSIKVAYGNTCQWFFESPEYIKWRDNSSLAEHHGFLWVRGKPGAGKSTLMRLSVKHADQKFPHDLRMSFFFNVKGALLESSVEGMFRSLLHQLLEQCPGLDQTIKQRAWNGPTWPVELLEEYFRDCVLILRGRDVTCHIDALDECEESDIRAMIEFFEDLGLRALSSHVRLRFCFASRHYPYISMSKCVQMVLDGHRGHQDDLLTYTKNNLRVMEPTIRDRLVPSIYNRARGTFLWLVHVIRVINKDGDRGHSQGVEARMDAIPVALAYLYEDAIFNRGSEDSRYTLSMLLWLTFAQRPLSTTELYHAVMFTSEAKSGAAVIDETLDSSRIERFILNTTKGLAEISPYNDKHVSFVQDTLRGYLQSSGISRLDNSKVDNPVGLSHDHLKTNCLEYILLAGRALPELLSSTPNYEHQRRLCAMFPLLDHTLSEVVAQAELAQIHGVSQKSFVEAFPLDIVLSLWNIVYRYDEKGRAYSLTATKTYIFAFSGAPNLLGLELESKNAHSGSQSSFHSSKSRKDPAQNSEQGKWGHPLHAAISIHDFTCVKLLLDHGFDPNASGLYSTALETAIRYHWNDMSILRLLLKRGADKNARRKTGKGDDKNPILHAAIDDGSLEAVRVLVEYGADIYAKGVDGMTALQHAMKWRIIRDPIIGYLIQREIQDAASAELSSWTIV